MPKKLFDKVFTLSVSIFDEKTRTHGEDVYIASGHFVDPPPPEPDPEPQVGEGPVPSRLPKPKRVAKPKPKKRAKKKPATTVKRPARPRVVRPPKPKKVPAPTVSQPTTRRVTDDDFYYLIRRSTGQYTRVPKDRRFQDFLEDALEQGYVLVDRYEYFDLKG